MYHVNVLWLYIYNFYGQTYMQPKLKDSEFNIMQAQCIILLCIMIFYGMVIVQQ